MFNKNRVQKYALFPTGSIPTNKDFASMFCEVDNARQEVFDCVFPNRLTRGDDAFSSSQPRLPVRQMFVVTKTRPHFAQRKRPSLAFCCLRTSFVLSFVKNDGSTTPPFKAPRALSLLIFYWQNTYFSSQRTYPHLWGYLSIASLNEHYPIMGMRWANQMLFWVLVFSVCPRFLPSSAEQT